MARIIVVEDEPITAADLEFKLTALGHHVVALADTGEDAVARTLGLAPDLALMDIRLRGAMTGIQAAEELRRKSDVPIIFLTAFADQETVDRACAALPYGYLLKPFTERGLVAAVQVALTRARTDKARRERERWLSAGMRSAGEALIAVDGEGLIRFINDQAESLLGIEARAALGKPQSQLLRWSAGEDAGPTSREPARSRAADDPLALALREGRITCSERSTLAVASSEAPIEVSYSAAPVPASGDAQAGAVLVFRALAPPGEQDAPAPGRGLTSLSARLSHEINNPLTYNLGALQLALRELDQLRAVSSLGGAHADAAVARRTEQLVRIERHLRDAQAGALRVAEVMRELSALSLNEAERSPLQLVELLDLAIGLSAVRPPEHARIERQFEPAPVVRGDKWPLARVLANGIQGAVALLAAAGSTLGKLTFKVTTDARGWGQVRVTARLLSPTGPSTEPSWCSKRPAEIDTGARAAQKLVEHQGGELTIREELDEYMIDLRLPAMELASGRSEQHSARSPPHERGSLLIIDDEPLIGRVLGISLQPMHDVTVVSSAQEALLLLERGDAFDLILSDLTMPGMNGQEFYERLRAVRPDLARRVVIMTAGACDESGERFLKEMSGRCIIKPFSIQQVLPLIAERVRARNHER